MTTSYHGNSKPIPLHRVAIVRPFVSLLEDIGAPVERAFRQAGLPYSALEDVNNYLPSHRFLTFLVNMSRSEGILDLGFRVGEKFGSNGADPRMSALLLSVPTLYQGLLKASELSNRTVTNCRVGLLQPPDSGHAYFFHRPSCRADNPAIDQIAWFGLMTCIGMIRVYTGPQWQPTEIGLMADHLPCRYIREQLPHTRMCMSQKFSYIALENRLLSLPPLAEQGTMPVSATHDCFQSVQKGFDSSLEQILRSYIQERNINIEFAAELCNTSKRTLQRRLQAKGTCFNELLARAQFSAASRMLQESGTTVTEMAYRLGYSDAAHFTRAFRRIAGVTPQVYRQQYKH
jgi:AraC-like DNA-binding protein